MARSAARRSPSSTSLVSGPWKGVFDSSDPYDADQNYLVDARNCYIADSVGGSGLYARQGFIRANNGLPLHTSLTAFRGQAIYPHTMLDGSVINFIVMAGRLFRMDSITTFTDVTPVGVTIDASIGTRVYFASVVGQLVVTDGVNRPWLASNLTSTPITGTYIDYDGAGVAWTAYGAPVVYGGAVFVILNSVNGVARRADISWCNPGTPLVGWQQMGYDNNWTLTQNESGSLYVLVATNLYLYYFRERSIGYATGTVGPDLASTATEDAVAFNVGATASALVQKYGNTIYFGDGIGRPYLFQPGTAPRDIWKQMRRVATAAITGFPDTTAKVASSAFEATRNLYVAAIWSPQPSTQAPPVEMVVFDAPSGVYQGRWTIGTGEGIDCLGNFVDNAGRSTLIALTTDGYVWALSSIGSQADDLATEGGLTLLTEGGVTLTTENDPVTWEDDGAVPSIFLVTDRLGYADDVVYNVDQCTVSTLTGARLSVSIETSSTASTVEGTPTPSPSQDGTYRLPVGCDVFGRGPEVTVTALTADEQAVFERVTLRAIPSLAGPEDA